MEENKIIEHLAIHDTKIEAMEKRLDGCEETNKVLTSLTQSITKMDVTLNNTNDTVKELKTDVHELKNVPTKRWDTITTAIITAISGGIIGYIVSTLF